MPWLICLRWTQCQMRSFCHAAVHLLFGTHIQTEKQTKDKCTHGRWRSGLYIYVMFYGSVWGPDQTLSLCFFGEQPQQTLRSCLFFEIFNFLKMAIFNWINKCTQEYYKASVTIYLVWFSFGLRFYVQVNNCSVMWGRSHRFLGITSAVWEVNVSCSRIQHGDPREDRTLDLSTRSPTLYH